MLIRKINIDDNFRRFKNLRIHFENWMNNAFMNEGLENLQNEFINEQEIKNRKKLWTSINANY